jgi:elongation factor 1-gamma
MVVGTLHTFEDNFRATKILLAAKYSGKEVKLGDHFELGVTNKTPEFLAKYPLAKVPALDLPDWVLSKQEGQPCPGLTESNAIAYYVSNETLRGGKEDVDKARVLQWMFFSDNELIPAVFNYLFPLLGLLPESKGSAKPELLRLLRVLDDYLKSRVYLVGEGLTLADLSVATSLMPLFQHGLDESERKPLPHLVRWFETVVRKKVSEAVIGKFEFCVRVGGQGLGVFCLSGLVWFCLPGLVWFLGLTNSFNFIRHFIAVKFLLSKAQTPTQTQHVFYQ